jgi:hypothetical protein
MDERNPNIAILGKWGRFHLSVLIGVLEVRRTEKKKSRWRRVANLEGEEVDPQPPTPAAPTESKMTKEEEHRIHGAREETERPRCEADLTAMNGDKA